MIKQLILKDFIIQWKFLIWYILYPVFFYMALTDTENLFIIMSVIITIGATVKTFEADSKNESEVIVNSLPILRKQIVYAKYIVAIIILFISVTVGCFTMGMKSGVNLFEFIETTIVASISFILVYLSLVLPLSFWLGYKKTIFIAIFILIASMAVSSIFFGINLEQIQLYNSLLFIGSICMFIASIFVSVKIYEKREF
ncbi:MULTISPECIES: ABC-2 transporter permease [Bacillus]|uniref:ABC-2 transporter permease n=2 Tax=Bacillus thuringiensis TaxID=1428 RepID=A0AAP4Q472_BACTU|nr:MULTISPECIES: ABC-2 transporter permease [Bacillus]MEC2874546.1 ABC-2 transporter permease [Bacillus cereus]AEA17894.1 ABC transporter permease protein [Bacillus thuringiensis serovar chinensis CT-43]AFV20042.1 ABC transporter permease protein [Bacillus thuringiensis Bt407]AGG03012.1 ABC transporter permease protein [Bacillus thuringiensis serovar thuringiensis str. IS5056]ERI03482.1 ABC-2 family transporter protein [Bacillus thuringiensis T01-328]